MKVTSQPTTFKITEKSTEGAKVTASSTQPSDNVKVTEESTQGVKVTARSTQPSVDVKVTVRTTDQNTEQNDKVTTASELVLV